MGKSSKSKTTNDPSPYAKSYVTPAANTLQSAYQQSQPMINNVSQTLGNAFGTAAKSAFSPSPELQAAQGYATDVLGGKYLGASNPYLNGMIDQTNQGVAGQVNTEFGAAGRTGSGAHVQNLTQGLANADNALRYQQYNDGINQMNTTLGQIPGLESAQYAGYAPTIALGQAAAGIPLDAASQYAGGIGSLLGQYNTKTQTNTPSGYDSAKDVIGTGLQIASLFSDRRLKTGIRKIGEHSDGLGKYAYRYVWGGPEREGVMADEVAKLRPWALGPVVDGYATVNYGAL